MCFSCRPWDRPLTRLFPVAIGLQAQFKSLKFLASIPPILFTAAFKHYLNKSFANEFNYYTPHHIDELSRSMVHSEGADVKLKERYENPALHDRGMSPMVHSEIMSRLQGIYHQKPRHSLSRAIFEKAVSDTNDDAVLEGIQITPVNEVRFLTQHVKVPRLT